MITADDICTFCNIAETQYYTFSRTAILANNELIAYTHLTNLDVKAIICGSQQLDSTLNTKLFQANYSNILPILSHSRAKYKFYKYSLMKLIPTWLYNLNLFHLHMPSVVSWLTFFI